MKLHLFKLSLLAIVGMNTLHVSAKVDDIGIVGPKGKVVLFYKDRNDYIIIKPCDNDVVLITSKDCKQSKGSYWVMAHIQTFRAAIISALKIPSVYTGFKDDLQKNIKIYNAVESKGLAQRLDNVLDFIKEYGIENADTNFLNEVKLLAGNNTIDYYTISSIVKDVNKSIEKIISEISNEGIAQDRIYKFSEKSSSIVFNALNHLVENRAHI